MSDTRPLVHAAGRRCPGRIMGDFAIIQRLQILDPHRLRGLLKEGGADEVAIERDANGGPGRFLSYCPGTKKAPTRRSKPRDPARPLRPESDVGHQNMRDFSYQRNYCEPGRL